MGEDELEHMIDSEPDRIVNADMLAPFIGMTNNEVTRSEMVEAMLDTFNETFNEAPEAFNDAMNDMEAANLNIDMFLRTNGSLSNISVSGIINTENSDIDGDALVNNSSIIGETATYNYTPLDIDQRTFTFNDDTTTILTNNNDNTIATTGYVNTFMNNNSTNVITLNRNSNTFKIEIDGTISNNDNSCNIFELMDEVASLREQVKMLIEVIPKKLGTRILRDKNKI